MKFVKTACVVLSSALVLSSCGTWSNLAKGSVIGAASGATGGALIGALIGKFTGNTAVGTAVSRLDQSGIAPHQWHSPAHHNPRHQT